MKIQKLILPVIIITLSLTACTTDSITDEEDISIEEVATTGMDGSVSDEDSNG
ncbi:hypothetical protein [Aquimarina algicola]|uniref:hypothetical protein n=1 Tax=Aquimarina algicola TaxID=2589995 RepID=UPI001CF1B290|nr:hypothetical protein [Aquimarina algicola]